MAIHILDAMAREGFEELIAIHDHASGLRAFLGIHDTARGPAFGGMRRWTYRDERHALIDCLRLARAMTQKCALAGLRAGGAKLVIIERPEMDRERAYRHIGRVVERMAGRYYTGPDVGTGPDELGWVAAETEFVTNPGPEGPGQLAEATAEGVFRGMAVALRHLDGEVDWPRRTVVVQGLGAVGRLLALSLAESGAHVVGAEVDPQRAQLASAELGIEMIPPASELDRDCDVFAPCALGGIVHDLSVERLRCRVIAGAANNILARRLHAERLQERGILYAPDVVLNSGALIRGCLFHLENRRESVELIGERVAATLDGILVRAGAEGDTPSAVAVREADERVARWRAE